MFTTKRRRCDSVAVGLVLIVSLAGATACGQQHEAKVAAASESIASPKAPSLSTAQRAKIMAFVRGRLAVQQELQGKLQALSDTYVGIDFDMIYAPSDLTSAQGIRDARARLGKFFSMVKDLDSVSIEHWRDMESLVLSADMHEPLHGQMRERFAAAKPAILENYRDWTEANSANGRAISDMLDFAAQNLGDINLDAGELVFANDVTHTGFKALLQQIENAKRINNEARDAALSVGDGITELLKAELSR